MRKLFVIALMALLFIAACTPAETSVEDNETIVEDPYAELDALCDDEYTPVCGKDGLTYQNSCYSSNRDVGIEHLGVCDYEVCDFNGQDHYMLPNMIYYEDNLERPYINVLHGTFRLQADGDGWTYIKAVKTEASYYSNRYPEYEAGVTESGNPIVCTRTTEVPFMLKQFLITHGHIVALPPIEEVQQEPTVPVEDVVDFA